MKNINNIQMVTEHSKIDNNGNYVLIKTSTKNVSEDFFKSINDKQAIWSFRRAGGIERSYKGKTQEGYDTLKKVSISPSKEWRIIRLFTLK